MATASCQRPWSSAHPHPRVPFRCDLALLASPLEGRDEILSRLLVPRRLCRRCQAIACLIGRTLTLMPMMMVVVVAIILQRVSIRAQAWPKRLVLCDPYEEPYQHGPPQPTVSLVLCVTLRSCYFMRSLARHMLRRPFFELAFRYKQRRA